jgi:hypothetical protein
VSTVAFLLRPGGGETACSRFSSVTLLTLGRRSGGFRLRDREIRNFRKNRNLPAIGSSKFKEPLVSLDAKGGLVPGTASHLDRTKRRGNRNTWVAVGRRVSHPSDERRLRTARRRRPASYRYAQPYSFESGEPTMACLLRPDPSPTTPRRLLPSSDGARVRPCLPPQMHARP